MLIKRRRRIIKVLCRVCGKEEEGMQNVLMDKGWCGIAVTINNRIENVSWCPKHNQPELAVQFVEKLKQGEISR